MFTMNMLTFMAATNDAIQNKLEQGNDLELKDLVARCNGLGLPSIPVVLAC